MQEFLTFHKLLGISGEEINISYLLYLLAKVVTIIIGS